MIDLGPQISRLIPREPLPELTAQERAFGETLMRLAKAGVIVGLSIKYMRKTKSLSFDYTLNIKA